MQSVVRRAGIREWVRRARPAFIGEGDEPLFLTDDGRSFSREGCGAMAQRIRRRLAVEGIAYKQHRLRSTCARRLHEAGYSDSAIMEILGWSSMAMLRRYLGKIPLAQLKLPDDSGPGIRPCCLIGKWLMTVCCGYSSVRRYSWLSRW